MLVAVRAETGEGRTSLTVKRRRTGTAGRKSDEELMRVAGRRSGGIGIGSVGKETVMVMIVTCEKEARMPNPSGILQARRGHRDIMERARAIATVPRHRTARDAQKVAFTFPMTRAIDVTSVINEAEDIFHEAGAALIHQFHLLSIIQSIDPANPLPLRPGERKSHRTSIQNLLNLTRIPWKP